ncbi:MAG: phosphatidylglycerol lysyltransferase domain-containing protein [Clostridia bacterium]|nr:phosphatidylglycerol lysyltransferase domain-containing protein [Clostridia bacterium]
MEEDILDFVEVSVDDKEVFDKYLEKFQPQASDLSFTNVYMWRHYFRSRYAIINGLLCVVAVPEKDEPFCFMPMGEINEDDFKGAVEALGRYFAKNGWKFQFRRVEEDRLQLFRNYVKSEKAIVFDRRNSDYVYLTQDLIKLAGKKYDGKRNHINKFKREHHYEYAAITPDNLEDCLRISNEWYAKRSSNKHRGLYFEKCAADDLLHNYERLGCTGAIIYVDGRPEAYTVGEMLNKDTAVILLEKANASIDGLYTLINQQFCENAWADTKYINREEDMGVEGLRKAKLSYHPAKLVNKYIISLG